jgi:6-phosphogluconolactonase
VTDAQDVRGAPTRGGVAGEPEVTVLPDPAAVSAAAARMIVRALRDAIAARGRADFATTGGSTPAGIYSVLATRLQDAVDWGRVHLWWGDDRYVPRDHPLSNVQPAESILLNIAAMSWESGSGGSGADVETGAEPGVLIPATNVHPWPTSETLGDGSGADACAARYAALVRSNLREEDGWPVFDLVLLGVGPDGHILSVFPDSPALDSDELALAIPAPTHVEPHVERVTLNPAVLDVAGQVLVVSHGESKAQILGRLFGEERDTRRWPAQRVRRPGVAWLIDEAAAAQLPPALRG